nr:MAG TPA: hypothetical protein [Caudoviricetes sp.]
MFTRYLLKECFIFLREKVYLNGMDTRFLIFELFHFTNRRIYYTSRRVPFFSTNCLPVLMNSFKITAAPIFICAPSLYVLFLYWLLIPLIRDLMNLILDVFISINRRHTY